MLRIFFFSLIILVTVVNALNVNSTPEQVCPNVKVPLGLIRMKRFLVFPDNSNVVLSMSLIKNFMVHAPSGWALAFEIDVLHPLPDANFTLSHIRKKLLHRQKREFLFRLQDAIELHNLNGRACILRSICEANTFLASPGKSLVHDVLRTIFRAPSQEELLDDEQGHYWELSDPQFCQQPNDCPFSILNFVLVLNKN